MATQRIGQTQMKESSALSYFVEHFAETQEADFQFSLPILEMIQPTEEEKEQKPLEDRSLGEIECSVVFRMDKAIDGRKEELPPIGLTEHSNN